MGIDFRLGGRRRVLAKDEHMTEKADKKADSKRAAPKKTAEGAPKLLSGGNPQIPKGDGDGPVQAYIEAMPGWKREVGQALDALVERLVPGVQKAVRWNSPFYGVEGQGWFLSFHCFTKYVKLTFHNGTSLSPLPPGASKHPNVRYFHLHENDEVEGEDLSSWIQQAAQMPGENLF